ncbi:SprT family zinc-dependent metalloprotease [Bacteroides sp. 51]|uniref:YgjP family zinc-dependent metalloprotease n=1 Tax=Bacteroides sp. 51 TaxID=2302938 RepID=UPI0013D4C1B2|nr:SprT family zinc-dependent metalloprotease [Bacteroides sp. 51]NDV80444.1 M48 family peptidase [Bacteroides sp. 51]
MIGVIEDKELGQLIVRVNPRARRLTFRTKPDAIYVTVPPGTTNKEIQNAIESLRHRLRAAQQRLPRHKKIDLDFRIDTPFFKLSVVTGQRDKFLAHSELGEMKIICPPTANFDDEGLQEWLRKVIEEALRRNAKIILPPRLYMLSNKHNLPYNKVKINSSRGRWGSCSTKKDINLSYFLVLLPQDLIDYVLLHELCHTREMNHSDRFWDLLNSVTDNKAFELRNELKKYKTDF